MCGATGAGRGAGDHVQYFPVSADSHVHLLAASLSFVSSRVVFVSICVMTSTSKWLVVSYSCMYLLACIY